jgi:hypothetical protein
MRNYVTVSGLIFLLVALGHLVRAMLGWPLIIAGRPLPAAISIVVTLASAAMAWWSWRMLALLPKAQ